MADVNAVRVVFQGATVGALAESRGRPGVYTFAYEPDFAARGIELSPLVMPLAGPSVRTFPELSRETFMGLPGLVADALPDRFGNLLINAHLSRQGRVASSITTLGRLLYTGHRAMGALEFEPAMPLETGDPPQALALRELVESARRAIRGQFGRVAPQLIQVGTSAGGARAKAVIGFNPTTTDIVSGQFDLPSGFEHWLLKFDGVNEEGQLGPSGYFGRIEYAYWVMAQAAGIAMTECRLLLEEKRAHFMTRRFDRVGNKKLHVQSLCALRHLDFNTPYVYDYEEYLRAILELGLGAPALEEGFRRMVFNVVAKNCDDHTKNLAFLMDPESGTWRLAPAFDMTFAHNPAPEKWTKQHQMLVNGKARNIERGDLLAVAKKFSIKSGADIVAAVEDAVAFWPTFAWSAGLSEKLAAEVARKQGLPG